MPVWKSAFLVLLLAVPGFASAEEDWDEPPRLTPEQLQKLHAMMDTDTNGKLSPDEVLKFLHHSRKSAVVKDTKSVMELADGSNDGKVSYDELTRYLYWGEFNESNNEKVADVDMFKAADGNSDGLLDQSELAAYLNPDTHDHVLQVIAQRTMEFKDLDKDGFLKFEEFLATTHIAAEQFVDEERMSLEQSFKKLDKDGNDKLDMKEFLTWESGFIDITYNIEKFMQLADTDGDQHMTVDEFHNAHKKGENEAHPYFIEMAQHHEL